MRGADTDGRTEGGTACQQQQSSQSVLYEANTSTKDYFLVPFKSTVTTSLTSKHLQLHQSKLTPPHHN